MAAHLRLAELERQIDEREAPLELLALATAIDELGRDLALELTRQPAQPELASVLRRVPGVHTRALLRTAEKLDDAGSPRRAVRVLIEALRKALDADMVEVVADALGFTFDAFGQQAASARLRALVTARAEPRATRRERRAHYLAAVDELAALVDWSALDDELAFA